MPSEVEPYCVLHCMYFFLQYVHPWHEHCVVDYLFVCGNIYIYIWQYGHIVIATDNSNISYNHISYVFLISCRPIYLSIYLYIHLSSYPSLYIWTALTLTLTLHPVCCFIDAVCRSSYSHIGQKNHL